MKGRRNRKKLSAVIITLNEEGHLERCLQSVRWVDEIVVVDSGSTDHTHKIALCYTDKVFFRAFDDYASQRNFAASKAAHDWVLYIDADEVATSGLRDEIKEELSGPMRFGRYTVVRENIYFGRPVRHVFGDDRPVRLYSRTTAHLEGAVHEKVVGGRVGNFRSALLHFGPQRYAQWVQKHRTYVRLEAAEHFRGGRRFSVWRTCLSPLRVFGLRYIRFGGWRDAAAGLVIASEMAFSTALYQLELLRLEKSGRR
jgi:(heptosyl)LPS beta-1,4-glucosyltransferase